MTELLALLPGVAYAARGSVADPGLVGKTKAMLKRAAQVQLEGGGFAIVEVLSNCPVGWNMTAPESVAHLAEVSQTYPLGVLVDRPRGTGSMFGALPTTTPETAPGKEAAAREAPTPAGQAAGQEA
jgi:2-oxoglutarate ferredoxin oxidoreductase subunit beta